MAPREIAFLEGKISNSSLHASSLQVFFNPMVKGGIEPTVRTYTFIGLLGRRSAEGWRYFP